MNRSFKLIRNIDSSGVSGTGIVAQGEVDDSGHVVLVWTVAAKLADGSIRNIETITLFNSWQDVILLHGHGGKTLLQWDDSDDPPVSDHEVLELDNLYGINNRSGAV